MPRRVLIFPPVLICSSRTVSAAVVLSGLGHGDRMVRCMLATVSLDSLFLLLTDYEQYQDDVEHMTPFLPRLYTLRQSGLDPLAHHRRQHPAVDDPSRGAASLPAAAPELGRDLRPLLALHRPDLDHRVPDARGAGATRHGTVTPEQRREIRPQMRVPFLFAALLSCLSGVIPLGALAAPRTGSIIEFAVRFTLEVRDEALPTRPRAAAA